MILAGMATLGQLAALAAIFYVMLGAFVLALCASPPRGED